MKNAISIAIEKRIINLIKVRLKNTESEIYVKPWISEFLEI